MGVQGPRRKEKSGAWGAADAHLSPSEAGRRQPGGISRLRVETADRLEAGLRQVEGYLIGDHGIGSNILLSWVMISGRILAT